MLIDSHPSLHFLRPVHRSTSRGSGVPASAVAIARERRRFALEPVQRGCAVTAGAVRGLRQIDMGIDVLLLRGSALCMLGLTARLGAVLNISWWISQWADRAPDKTALRFEGRSSTYAELERRIARLAGLLATYDVRPGDRVAYLGPNCPEILEVLFACGRIGAIFVPLNARMPPPELCVFVKQSEPRLLVAEGSFRDAAVASAPELRPDQVIVFDADGLEPHVRDAMPVGADRELHGAAPILIAYTSGTSGTPKGAVLTHEALTSNALDSIAAFEMTADDEVLTAAPMFHVGGLNIHTTPALCAGATVTIHRRFDPALALEEIGRVRATLFVAVPAMSLAMTGDPSWPDADIRSLRCVATGSTHVPDTVIGPWLDRGVPVLQVYGLTETCPIATVVPLHAPRPKASTAGRPVIHCRVSIVDAFSREMPALEVGEVAIRGPNVMQGYWRNPEATRGAFRHGWFCSGDVGFFDEDGYLHILERIKDLIIVGGSNVYPADLEQVLAETPEIAEAAVVARPDPDLGEVPVACVVVAAGHSLTPEQVIARFQARLAAYKHPRDVVFLDRLPRTSLGKVQKHALRALVRDSGMAATAR
jgi:fatty-acyl-CoA synthase